MYASHIHFKPICLDSAAGASAQEHIIKFLLDKTIANVNTLWNIYQLSATEDYSNEQMSD
jgi:hypothetical protein